MGTDVNGLDGTIQRVDYYRMTVQDQPGESLQLLSVLNDLGIELLAFAAIPSGEGQAQLTVFPSDPARFAVEAKKGGLELDGPHVALMVTGDTDFHALAEVHRALFEANVNVSASTGMTSSKGGYSYVIYLRTNDVDRAAAALGL